VRQRVIYQYNQLKKSFDEKFDKKFLVCESKYMEDQTQGQTGEAQQPVQSAAPAQPAPAVAPEMAPAKKSSWAKMLLMYIVLAVIVYGVIYYFFF